jgi:hypothetical protein
MRVPAEGLFSLKLWILSLWLLALFSYQTVLERLGLWQSRAERQIVLGSILLLGGAFLFSITVVPKFRQLFIAKRREHLYEPAPFILLGFIFLMLGLGTLVVGALLLQGICVPHRTIRC